ncbi:MAG: response regulator transcription factor [Rubrobacter sp.]|nr:response regulator transcription factor [Rubrobacter sp.]
MRIVVADGHPVARVGTVNTLSEMDARAIGEFGTGEEALAFIEKAKPDLVVLALNLTGKMDGIETLAMIKKLEDPPFVLVFTGHNTDDDVVSCMNAGADGFVHKRASEEQFLKCVERVASGKRAWHPGEKVGDPRSRIHTAPDGEPLTRRQREVLALILRRYTNEEIAEVLAIQLQTAKNHVRAVFQKLPYRNRRELFGRDRRLRK